MYLSGISLRACLSPILAICLLSLNPLAGRAQEPQAPAAALELSQAQAIPNLVRYQGSLPGSANQEIVLRLSIYATEDSTSPLWQESQLVKTDPSGSYTLLLGAGSAIGLPGELFAAGEPRWLGIQAGDREESRSLLTSVPYAMKAADADSLGGQPAASFVTQSQLAARLKTSLLATPPNSLLLLPNASPTGAGSTGYLPIWSSASALGNSNLFQAGSGPAANVGIGTTNPATMLDVQGATTLRAVVTLAGASATASAGVSSPTLKWSASSFNSASNAPVAQSFLWQAAPTGNNTSSPSANLRLLFASGTAAPSLTGLSIAPNGVITFAPSQTFPITGTGGGTITGVTAGSGLTGGGTAGKVTLAVDPSKVAMLGAANTFTQENAFNAETSVTANSTDWALVVTNTSTTAKGTLLGQAQGSNLGIEGASPGGSGVKGATNTGNGVEGSATTGLGGYFHNTSTSAAALAGEANSTAGTAVGVFGSAANGNAVYGTASGIGNGVYGTSANGYGVSGTSTTSNGVNGHSTSGYGVLGFSANSYGVAGESTSSYGVYGNSGSGIAIYGSSGSPNGIAVKGSVPQTTNTEAIYGIIGKGNQFNPAPVGFAVLGDVQGGLGAVGGFSDSGAAGVFENNEAGVFTVYVENDGSGKFGSLPDVVLATSPYGTCGFGGSGDMTCTGQVKSLVTTASARRVETYSVQSSENWLEDYGSETLQNGVAIVKLDAAFLDAANTGVAYHVFLTPKGDANTLYVTNETASGFEVRESGKGQSSIAFDYRIVAKRRGHEQERLVDVTGKLEADLEQARAKVHPRPALQPAEPSR